MTGQLSFCLFISLILLPLLDCNKQIFMSDSFVEFIYENYDIDAFDHCQFLFDAEELILQDEMIGHYHANIRKCKSTFFVNKNLTYEPFNADERKMNLRFPVMYYISVSSTSPTRISKFLQNISSIGLANDIWLIAMDISGASLKTEGEISNIIQDLLPSLQLDSQVFIIIPMDNDCDKFSVYETYKVSSISTFHIFIFLLILNQITQQELKI